ncbi:MAG TPA: protein kinase [Vicinamibacterales bacterium]|nr:protein kinase [Vicinamibacterales bacterium]
MASDDLDRWQSLSPFLDQALDIDDEAERDRWLHALRERDPETAEGLARLLAQHRAVVAGGFLERGVPLPPGGGALAGQVIGAYTLVSPIGEGGMSSVWLAERSDGRFARRAAVKFLSIALAGRGEERFRREGLILARLAHPSVAQLLDAGVTASGQPYLVLEYVEGEHLDVFCDRRRLDVAARLALLLEVLDAVGEAHAHLIVHRDLKPSNVLVGSDGRVKLLDFGIAKLLDEAGPDGSATMLTRDQGSALTLAYAAPEQVLNGPITTATDVYALGVLLYGLLTGQHPAGAARRSQADLLKAITETNPRRPSEAVVRGDADAGTRAANATARGATPDRLHRTLRGDLDTIVGQALKKNPAERYGSVDAFGADLRRYLRHEPIGARPDRVAYRAGKFVRRNRVSVALAAAVIVAAAAGVVGTVLQARTASAQRDFAIRQLARATALNDLNSFVLSDAAPQGGTFTVNDLLDRADRIVEHPSTPPDAGRVDLLVSIGRQYLWQDERASGRRVLTKAYGWAQTIDDPAVRAEAACSLGMAMADTGQLARAEALVNEGLQALPPAPLFDLDRIDCLRQAGDVARSANASQQALDEALEARRLLAAAPFHSGLLDVSTLIDLGESYRLAGRPGDAAGVFEQASAKLAALGRDRTQQAGTLDNNWALALNQDGRVMESERMFRRAIEISRDNRGEEAVSPMLLINYARELDALDRETEAADYAERGYEKARRAGDEVVINQSLLMRAAIYRAQGDLARAEAMLAQVEPRLRRSLPPTHIAFAAIFRERALIAEARHDLPAALDLTNRCLAAIEVSIKAGGSGATDVAFTLVRRSGLERQLGQIDNAAADAQRGLQMMLARMHAGQVSSQLGLAYLNLGRVRLAQQQPAAARTALTSAVHQLEQALGANHADARAARELLDHLKPKA